MTCLERARITSQRRLTTASREGNTSFLNPHFRSSFQICSIGFISGVYGGMKSIWILSGITRPFDLCHRAPSQIKRISSLGYSFDNCSRKRLIWHHQKKAFSCSRFHSPICVAIFTNMVAWRRGTFPFPAPASLGFVDSSESRFILEHDPDVPALTLVCYSVVMDFNFFEESCSSLAAAFGCFGRGITFRHPCRFSTRYA